eukprot:4817112-Pyramimonas_sp.AAC.1
MQGAAGTWEDDDARELLAQNCAQAYMRGKNCRWLCELCWVRSLEQKVVEVPIPNHTDGGAKKTLQQRLQEYKRRLEGARFRKKARTLPPLASLPIGYGRPNSAPTFSTLKDLVMRAPLALQPSSAGAALPPHRLSDGRFGADAHRAKVYAAMCDTCPQGLRCLRGKPVAQPS